MVVGMSYDEFLGWLETMEASGKLVRARSMMAHNSISIGFDKPFTSFFHCNISVVSWFYIICYAILNDFGEITVF